MNRGRKRHQMLDDHPLMIRQLGTARQRRTSPERERKLADAKRRAAERQRLIDEGVIT